jgi:hypothetical protein
MALVPEGPCLLLRHSARDVMRGYQSRTQSENGRITHPYEPDSSPSGHVRDGTQPSGRDCLCFAL